MWLAFPAFSESPETEVILIQLIRYFALEPADYTNESAPRISLCESDRLYWSGIACLVKGNRHRTSVNRHIGETFIGATVITGGIS